MRELKCRAWNKEEKKMIPFNKLGLDMESGFAEVREFDTATEKYKEGTPNFVLMLYTGLNDKNGKEIYEGDSDGFYIVKHGEFPVRCHETSEVIDNAVGWYLDPIDKSMEPFNWEIPLNSFWINRLDDGFDKNIYDNPELLETK